MIILRCSDLEIAVILEGLSTLPLHKSFDTFVSVRNQTVAAKQAQGMPMQGQMVGTPPASQPTPPGPPAEPVVPSDQAKADTAALTPEVKNGGLPN